MALVGIRMWQFFHMRLAPAALPTRRSGQGTRHDFQENPRLVILYNSRVMRQSSKQAGCIMASV